MTSEDFRHVELFQQALERLETGEPRRDLAASVDEGSVDIEGMLALVALLQTKVAPVPDATAALAREGTDAGFAATHSDCSSGGSTSWCPTCDRTCAAPICRTRLVGAVDGPVPAGPPHSRSGARHDRRVGRVGADAFRHRACLCKRLARSISLFRQAGHARDQGHVDSPSCSQGRTGGNRRPTQDAKTEAHLHA